MKKTFKRNALMLILFVAISLLAVNVFAGETQNITEGFRSFSANGTGCWFCALFKTIFCAGNAMAVAIFNSLAKSCINLAAIIMALWVCWMVFKLFLGFSSDASGFFANFFKALVVFVTCVFILDEDRGGGADFVFDTFINPILETTADLSVSIMGVGFAGAEGESLKNIDLNTNYDPSSAILTEMNGDPFNGSFSSLGNPTCSGVTGGFSDTALLKFLQMIQAMNLKLIQVMVAGKALWNTGFNQDGFFGFSLDYIFSGLLLMVVAVWILITTMFKLVDAVIRMLFSCALTPLYVMFWIFPKTRGYTTAAVKMFVTSMCFFIITATLLTFAIILIGGDKIKSALTTLEDDNSYEKLTEGFSMSKGGFLLTIATSIIATSLIDMADPLASSFGGSSSVGGAGKALQGLTGKAVGGAGRLAGGVAKKGAAAVGNAGLKAAGAGYRKLKTAVANKLSKGAGGGKSFGGGGAGKEAGKTAGKAAGKATEQTIQQGSKAAAQGVQAAGNAAATGVEAGGQAAGSAMQGAGNAMTQAGAGLSSTGVGAILGAPMMAVGAATTATGAGVQAASKAAGQGIRAASKAAAKGVEAAGKAVGKAAGKVVEKGVGKATETAVNSAMNGAEKIADAGKKDNEGDKKNA